MNILSISKINFISIVKNIKVVLPPLDTYYYCNIFQVPTNLTQKRHILKVILIFIYWIDLKLCISYILILEQWEIILPKINLKNIHHMVVYECSDNYFGLPKFNAGDCNKNTVKHQYCQTITHT